MNMRPQDGEAADPTTRLAVGTRAQAIADELTRHILAGEIEAGTRLRQQDVADRFGMSTSPVREAFALLERSGLIKRSEHRGAIVFRPTVSDLRENYEIRSHLESLAVALAAEQISAEQIQALRLLLDEMEHITEPAKYAEYNDQFHSLLYAAANRPQLSLLINELRQAARAYVQIMAGHQSDTARTHAQHEHIFEAVSRRDAAAAADALEWHLRHNFEVMLQNLDGAEDRRATVADALDGPSPKSRIPSSHMLPRMP